MGNAMLDKYTKKEENIHRIQASFLRINWISYPPMQFLVISSHIKHCTDFLSFAPAKFPKTTSFPGWEIFPPPNFLGGHYYAPIRP